MSTSSSLPVVMGKLSEPTGAREPGQGTEISRRMKWEHRWGGRQFVLACCRGPWLTLIAITMAEIWASSRELTYTEAGLMNDHTIVPESPWACRWSAGVLFPNGHRLDGGGCERQLGLSFVDRTALSCTLGPALSPTDMSLTVNCGVSPDLARTSSPGPALIPLPRETVDQSSKRGGFEEGGVAWRLPGSWVGRICEGQAGRRPGPPTLPCVQAAGASDHSAGALSAKADPRSAPARAIAQVPWTRQPRSVVRATSVGCCPRHVSLGGGSSMNDWEAGEHRKGAIR